MRAVIEIIIIRIFRCCPCVDHTIGEALILLGSHHFSVNVIQDLPRWPQSPSVEKLRQSGAIGFLSGVACLLMRVKTCLWLWFMAAWWLLPAFSHGPELCSGQSQGLAEVPLRTRLNME